jgi:tetratricopeptide (TPR) repeat protein
MDAFDRGADAAERGDLDLAIASFTEAIRLNSKDAQAYYNRAACYWRAKKLKQAVTDLEEAIRLMPNHARSHGIRGAIYLEKEEDEQAIAELTEALRHDPKLVEGLWLARRGVRHPRPACPGNRRL